MTSATVVASKLSKSFGEKQVLQEMSFGVSPGDVIGVLEERRRQDHTARAHARLHGAYGW
jgi:ABC-type lipopolysaccharide export system ATPase subunit